MTIFDSPPSAGRRIPQLDGLRGVAITMVVFCHYGTALVGPVPRFPGVLAGLLNMSWSGVDLFFVLSGFLIGGILLNARESPNYFQVFYRRRVCRIFPLYFAFLIVFLFVAHFLQRSEVENLFRSPIPWQSFATFTQNFWMAGQNTIGSPILNPTWSLAIEEQFYLTLPALIYFVKPNKLIWVVTGGIVLAPLIRLAIFVGHPKLIMAVAVLLPCRMDSLLFGVATAYFMRRQKTLEFLRVHRRHLWTAIEILTGICALFVISPSMYYPPMTLIGYDCLGLLYTSLIVASLVDDGFARALRVKWLMSLGTISYCVYLIHQLVFVLTYMLLRGHPNSWLVTSILAIFLTISIAKLSWKYFERPLLELGQREHYAQAAVALP